MPAKTYSLHGLVLLYLRMIAFSFLIPWSASPGHVLEPCVLLSFLSVLEKEDKHTVSYTHLYMFWL